MITEKFFVNELGFDDVSIRPRISKYIESRNDVNILTNYGKMKAMPYFVTNMSTVGNPKSARFLSKFNVPVAIHKYVETYELEKLLDEEAGRFSFISVGLDDYSARHLPLLGKQPYLLIDVPNGYIRKFYALVENCRNKYPDAWIIAGNVTCKDACDRLIKLGVNCVRLGIGGGSVCRTSNKTGVGRKPISAIMECMDNPFARVCWDGGVRGSSDICKALQAGADYVSCGRLFAPFVEINQNEPTKQIYPSIEDVARYHLCNFPTLPPRLPYYGMSSEHANNKYAGGLKEYRAAEGVMEYLEIQKNPEAFIEDINGSIRSYMTYAGRKSLLG